MSGEIDFTPGKRWTDPEEPIDYRGLDATAQGVAQMRPLSVGARELIPADVLALFPALGAGANMVINSNFDIWQRGGFPNSAGLPVDMGATTGASDIWGADHWGIGLAAGAGRRSVHREVFTAGQTAVPNEPTYFLRWAQTTSQASQRLTHAIEDVRTLAGQALTVIFWAKSAQSVSLGVRMGQNWGGSPAPAAVYSATQNAALVAGASWKQYVFNFTMPSVAGHAISFPGNALSLEFMMPSGIWTIDIAQVQVVQGTFTSTRVPAYQTRTVRAELDACMRYFEYSSGSTSLNIGSYKPVFYFSVRKYADQQYNPAIVVLSFASGTGATFVGLFDCAYMQNTVHSTIAQFFIQAESEIYINPA